MKQTQSRVVEIARVEATSGSEHSHVDSVINIPPDVQPVTRWPYTLKPVFPIVAINTEDSQLVRQVDFQAGAGAGGVNTQLAMAGGIWRFSGALWMFFTGTTNLGVFSGIGLQAPTGQNLLFASAIHQTGLQAVLPYDVVLALAEPGWKLITQKGATIAGDVIAFNASTSAERLI